MGYVLSRTKLLWPDPIQCELPDGISELKVSSYKGGSFSNRKRMLMLVALHFPRFGVLFVPFFHGCGREDFTKGATKTLVATDVAARGLDVEDITLVVCCLTIKCDDLSTKT